MLDSLDEIEYADIGHLDSFDDVGGFFDSISKAVKSVTKPIGKAVNTVTKPIAKLTGGTSTQLLTALNPAVAVQYAFKDGVKSGVKATTSLVSNPYLQAAASMGASGGIKIAKGGMGAALSVPPKPNMIKVVQDAVKLVKAANAPAKTPMALAKKQTLQAIGRQTEAAAKKGDPGAKKAVAVIKAVAKKMTAPKVATKGKSFMGYLVAKDGHVYKGAFAAK